jgi:hypothetical protein
MCVLAHTHIHAHTHKSLSVHTYIHISTTFRADVAKGVITDFSDMKCVYMYVYVYVYVYVCARAPTFQNI